MNDYTMTEKRKMADLVKTDISKRISIYRMREEGKTFQEIGDVYGITRQAVRDIYEKIKDQTIEELEDQQKLILYNKLET